MNRDDDQLEDLRRAGETRSGERDVNRFAERIQAAMDPRRSEKERAEALTDAYSGEFPDDLVAELERCRAIGALGMDLETGKPRPGLTREQAQCWKVGLRDGSDYESVRKEFERLGGRAPRRRTAHQEHRNRMAHLAALQHDEEEGGHPSPSHDLESDDQVSRLRRAERIRKPRRRGNGDDGG